MSAQIAQLRSKAEVQLPLVVNLSGTLVKSNTTVDSFLHLVRKNPTALMRVLRSLSRKASLSSQLENAASLDVQHLPYNRSLITFLQQQSCQGRRLYVATSGDGRLAQRIIEHLGIFDGKLVLQRGVSALPRGDRLIDRKALNHQTGFAFIGHSKADLTQLKLATERMAANPSPSLLRKLAKSHIALQQTFLDGISPWRTIRKAFRLHQWAKNLLLFVPLLLSHALGFHPVLLTTIAFVCFSLCASATYILNDLLDMEADRRHPQKRLRPFAAGDLSASTGMVLVAISLAGAFTCACFLSGMFAGWLLGYLSVTIAYSLILKRIVLVDVITLSGLYTVRLLAGAAVTETAISPWLAAFSLFLFLSLAMVKRLSELHNLQINSQVPDNGRGYLLDDLEALRSFGTASGYASVVVFTLYINGHDIAGLYTHPSRMWLIAPLLVWWISRFWLLAGRGELDEDPVVFALTDRTSLLIGLCIAVVGLLAL